MMRMRCMILTDSEALKSRAKSHLGETPNRLKIAYSDLP